MFCIVLDFELEDVKTIRGLGVLADGNDQVYSFCPPKTYNPTKKPCGVQDSCTLLSGTKKLELKRPSTYSD